MKSPKNALIVLLAATTVGGAILAWRQSAELTELRAAAMNKAERADLQKRAWDLEKLNRELRDQLAARRAGEMGGGDIAMTDGSRPGRDGNSRGPGRGGVFDPRRETELQQAKAVRELMNKPEVQALINQQQKTAIEVRYAALFKSLNLPTEQADKVKALLVERTTTMQDIMSASFDQGINPRENPDGFRKLMTDAQNEINQSIRSVIGDQGFAQLSNYEQTLPQRALVNELQQRLSYTNTPLTSGQADQLVQILATNSPQRQVVAQNDSGAAMRPPQGAPSVVRGSQPAGFDIGGMIAGIVGGGPGMVTGTPDGAGRGVATLVTPAAVNQSQTVLSPPQVTALQQIQQQQQAQQQLRQMITDTLSTNRPAPAAPGSSPIAPPPTSTAPGAARSGPRGG